MQKGFGEESGLGLESIISLVEEEKKINREPLCTYLTIFWRKIWSQKWAKSDKNYQNLFFLWMAKYIKKTRKGFLWVSMWVRVSL